MAGNGTSFPQHFRGPHVADYKQITTDVAKQIAEHFEKSQVVVWAWDPAHELVHVTTYGVSAEDKVVAAQSGELVGQVLGLDRSKQRSFQDFRQHFDAGLF